MEATHFIEVYRFMGKESQRASSRPLDISVLYFHLKTTVDLGGKTIAIFKIKAK